jgi:hypothetical protein
MFALDSRVSALGSNSLASNVGLPVKLLLVLGQSRVNIRLRAERGARSPNLPQTERAQPSPSIYSLDKKNKVFYA